MARSSIRTHLDECVGGAAAALIGAGPKNKRGRPEAAP